MKNKKLTSSQRQLSKLEKIAVTPRWAQDEAIEMESNPEYDKQSQMYYHGTLNQLLPAIKKNGLLPPSYLGGGNNFIYLTQDSDASLNHALQRMEFLWGRHKYHKSKEELENLKDYYKSIGIDLDKDLYPVLLEIELQNNDPGWCDKKWAKASGFYRYEKPISWSKIKVIEVFDKAAKLFKQSSFNSEAIFKILIRKEKSDE